MELTLPSKLNASETIVLDTNVLVGIGANGGRQKFVRQRSAGALLRQQ